MIYTHVLSHGPASVRSPADGLWRNRAGGNPVTKRIGIRRPLVMHVGQGRLMRYLSLFFLVAVFVGCPEESTTPKAIAGENELEEEIAQSSSPDSEAIPKRRPTITVKHQGAR